MLSLTYDITNTTTLAARFWALSSQQSVCAAVYASYTRCVFTYPLSAASRDGVSLKLALATLGLHYFCRRSRVRPAVLQSSHHPLQGAEQSPVSACQRSAYSLASSQQLLPLEALRHTTVSSLASLLVQIFMHPCNKKIVVGLKRQLSRSQSVRYRQQSPSPATGRHSCRCGVRLGCFALLLHLTSTRPRPIVRKSRRKHRTPMCIAKSGGLVL